MGLKGGILGGHNLRLAGASGSLSLTFGNGGQMLPIVQMNQYYGIPGGYSLGRGYVGPVKVGGLGALARGDASHTASISGYGNVGGTAAGEATTALTGFRTFSRSGTAAGVATFSAGISGIGRIAASLSIGSRPTAEDIISALYAAAAVNPLPSNIKQVNDYDVDGAGTTGDPWGPV